MKFHIYSGEANPHNSGNYKFRVVAETYIPLWFCGFTETNTILFSWGHNHNCVALSTENARNIKTT